MAAGALLITEAGGLVADPSGEQNFMEVGDIVVATPKIFPAVLEALR
jgi:myo-inositol-1(or 4)-monophosphatase